MVDKAGIISNLTYQTELSKKDTAKVLDIILNLIQKSLVKRQRVQLM